MSDFGSDAFVCFPRILAADSECAVEIRPARPNLALAEGETYEVIHETVERLEGERPVRLQAQARDGALRVSCRFVGEQGHLLLVRSGAGERLGMARAYSLAPDLLACRPLRGDFHMHSTRSDGKQPPAHVAARCRQIGLDFMAVTDHRVHEPSLEALAAFCGVAHDLAIFRGEEVHPPDCEVHIVNFGGAAGVNRFFKSEQYARQVAARAEALAGSLLPHVDAVAAAACAWVFDAIRADGGLAVFCHPYWMTGEFAALHHNVAAGLMDHLFDARQFDAFELIGGYVRSEREANALQVARYVEETARRGPMPILGASDAHSDGDDHTLGWYWTLVFARSDALEDILEAVRDCRAVAVESLPGEMVRCYGPTRLVKYAFFLMEAVLPEHDRLCDEEGRAMLAHLAGDADAAGRLATLSGRCAAHYAGLGAPPEGEEKH